jgi:hypothetical protein
MKRIVWIVALVLAFAVVAPSCKAKHPAKAAPPRAQAQSGTGAPEAPGQPPAGRRMLLNPTLVKKGAKPQAPSSEGRQRGDAQSASKDAGAGRK